MKWTAIAEKTLAKGGSRGDLAVSLSAVEEKEIAAENLREDILERYRRLCPMPENSAGLYRWASKKAE